MKSCFLLMNEEIRYLFAVLEMGSTYSADAITFFK
jgi:hypothetical protein